jgi:hypothetical protein
MKAPLSSSKVSRVGVDREPFLCVLLAACRLRSGPRPRTTFYPCRPGGAGHPILCSPCGESGKLVGRSPLLTHGLSPTVMIRLPILGLSVGVKRCQRANTHTNMPTGRTPAARIQFAMFTASVSTTPSLLAPAVRGSRFSFSLSDCTHNAPAKLRRACAAAIPPPTSRAPSASAGC